MLTCKRLRVSVKKQRGQREQNLKNLPIETIQYRLSEENQVCSCCGGNLHEMSTETRQEIEVILTQVKLKKHIRHVYSCRHCERHEIEIPFVTAKMRKRQIILIWK